MGCDYPNPSQASVPSTQALLAPASPPSPAVLGGPPGIPRKVLAGETLTAELLPPVLTHHITQLQGPQFIELGIQCE